MNKPLLLLLFVLAVVTVTQGGTYNRPVHQRYPWTSYTTESTEVAKTSGEGAPLQPLPSSVDLSDRAQVIRPLAASEVGDVIHCGYFFRAPCNLAKRRRLQSSSSGVGDTASVSPVGGEDILKTSASEFHFRNSGGEDRRVYGTRSRSYDGYSSYSDPINGQEFNSRSFVLPSSTYAIPVQSIYGPDGVFHDLFGNIVPRKQLLYTYTLICIDCEKTGERSITHRPSVDHKGTRVPIIYRTTTEKIVTAGSTTTTNAPETITTTAPEETNTLSFSGESKESSEYDEKVFATTTELLPATTTIPDYEAA